MNTATRMLATGRILLSSLDRKKDFKAEFERVALPELSHLYTAAFYLTKDKTEAEDLIQETYLRAFRFFSRFQPGMNCKAWLLTILRNLFISQYRQKRQEPRRVDWERIDQVYESMVEQGENGDKASPESLLFSQLMDKEV